MPTTDDAELLRLTQTATAGGLARGKALYRKALHSYDHDPLFHARVELAAQVAAVVLPGLEVQLGEHLRTGALAEENVRAGAMLALTVDAEHLTDRSPDVVAVVAYALGAVAGGRLTGRAFLDPTDQARTVVQLLAALGYEIRPRPADQ